MTKWTPDKDIQKKYLELCETASSSHGSFNKFRSNPNYDVVESGEKKVGHFCLYNIKIFDKAGINFLVRNFNEISKNDKVGSPITHNFKYFKKKLASSTIQYSCDLYKIKKIVKTKKKLKIIEIGPGYGGLARLLMAFLKIDKYTLLDLKSPNKLCRKYLSQYSCSIGKFFNNDALKNYQWKNKKFDIFISSGSLAELDAATQKKYFNGLIPRCSFVYIVYNTLSINSNQKFLLKELKRLENTFDIKFLHTFSTVLEIYMVKKIDKNKYNLDIESLRNFKLLTSYLNGFRFITQRMKSKFQNYYFYWFN